LIIRLLACASYKKYGRKSNRWSPFDGVFRIRSSVLIATNPVGMGPRQGSLSSPDWSSYGLRYIV
jgi:hypothetical protein